MAKINKFKKFLVVGIVIVIFSVYFGFNHQASSSTTDNVSGWAWSADTGPSNLGVDNGGMGWLSFNCVTDPGGCTNSNYGVTVNPTTGYITGYAWAGNYDPTLSPAPSGFGWLEFGNLGSYSSDFPSGPGTTADNAKVNADGTVTGWARFCGVFQSGCSGSLLPSTSTGGWDGWVSLSGTGYGVTVNNSTGALSGNAWGGPDDVGWINFNTNPYGKVITGGSSSSITLSPTNQTVNVAQGGSVNAYITAAKINVGMGVTFLDTSFPVTGLSPHPSTDPFKQETANNAYGLVVVSANNNVVQGTYNIFIKATGSSLTEVFPANLINTADASTTVYSTQATISVTVTPPIGGPSGTLVSNYPSCTIPRGSSNCSVILTWNTTNPIDTSTVNSYINDAGFSTIDINGNPTTNIKTANSGSQPVAIPYNGGNGRTFLLSNGGYSLARTTVVASCAPNIWDSTSKTCVSSTQTVAGSCGSANGSNSQTIPTTNLCDSADTASAVSGSGPWNWTCTGPNGGSTVSCSTVPKKKPIYIEQ